MTEKQENGPAELREALERVTARAETAEAELRGLKISTAFEKAQVPAAAASLYTGEDTTPKAIAAWANAHGIQVGEAPTVAPKPEPVSDLPEDGRAPAAERILSTGPTAEADPGLASMAAAAGSHEAVAGQAMPARMSHQEFTQMLSDPATHDQAVRAYAEGRVERHEQNVQADQMKAKGLLR
jgi:hypothetical protein